MYAIGVCNIATKLFLMPKYPAAVEPPLRRDADQPDAEQLAFNLENDFKGTGVETIVVCPQKPIEHIVALMKPSELVCVLENVMVTVSV